MSDKVLLSIFTWNVEPFIKDLFNELKKYNHLDKEIICLNNLSTDNTVNKINELKTMMKIQNLKVISHKKNMGFGYNKKVSFDYAINNNFSKIVFIHGDNQYPASHINNLLALLDDNTMAYGSRFLNKKSVKEHMPLIKYYANPFLTKIINFISKTNHSEYFSGFRGYKVLDLKKINYHNLANSWVFEQQMMFEIMIRNMKIATFPIPTVYGDQVSSVPPFRYCVRLFISVFNFFILKRLRKL